MALTEIARFCKHDAQESWDPLNPGTFSYEQLEPPKTWTTVTIEPFHIATNNPNRFIQGLIQIL